MRPSNAKRQPNTRIAAFNKLGSFLELALSSSSFSHDWHMLLPRVSKKWDKKKLII